MIRRFNHIAVIGAGSWGTALAIHIARQDHRVTLWAHSKPRAREMAKRRENNKYLSGIVFPTTLQVTANIAEALSKDALIIFAVPSGYFSQTITEVVSEALDPPGVIWATKGLDPSRGCLLHEVVMSAWGDKLPMGYLAGPSFAREVACGLPTAVALSVRKQDSDFAQSVLPLLHSETFRVYTNEDMVGSEIGGALKNILAIAVGISDGLGLGANARAALITRGLAEMSRLNGVLGGQQETMLGLTGLGDLVLTATDDQSRNRQFGMRLGRGMSVRQALLQIGQVVEGYMAAKSLQPLMKKQQVDMPLCEAVFQILYGEVSVRDMMQSLLSRPARTE